MLATIVFLVCSVGPSGCGAAGDANDATRPQDLAVVRKYKACYDRGLASTHGMAELRGRCARLAGITEFRDDARRYAGPWVSYETGKPITVHLTTMFVAPTPMVNPPKISTLEPRLQKTKIVRCFPNIADNLFYRHGFPYRQQPSSREPRLLKMTSATANEFSQEAIEEPPLGPAANLFHRMPGGPEDSSINFAYIFSYNDSALSPYMGSVAFWVSYEDTGIKGFIDVPEHDTAGLPQLLLKVDPPNVTWNREVSSTLPYLNRIPNAYRVRACGMSEVALEYSAPGGGYGERVTLIVENASLHIVAERFESGA